MRFWDLQLWKAIHKYMKFRAELNIILPTPFKWLNPAAHKTAQWILSHLHTHKINDLRWILYCHWREMLQNNCSQQLWVCSYKTAAITLSLLIAAEHIRAKTEGGRKPRFCVVAILEDWHIHSTKLCKVQLSNNHLKKDYPLWNRKLKFPHQDTRRLWIKSSEKQQQVLQLSGKRIQLYLVIQILLWRNS